MLHQQLFREITCTLSNTRYTREVERKTNMNAETRFQLELKLREADKRLEKLPPDQLLQKTKEIYRHYAVMKITMMEINKELKILQSVLKTYKERKNV